MAGKGAKFSLELEVRRRPCVFLSALLILGILAGEFVLNPWLLAGALAVFLVAMLAVRLPTLRLGIAVATLLLGWFLHRHHTAIRLPHDLRLLIGERARVCEIEGIVVSRPQTRVSASASSKRIQTQLDLEVSRICLQSRWQTAYGRIRVQVNAAPMAGVHRGQRIRLAGILGLPQQSLVEGPFDFRKILRYQDIHYVMTLRDWNPKASILEPKTTRPLPSRFQDWARRALTIGQPRKDEAMQLIWAMVLGWRAGLTDELRKPFVQSGTFHVFAISGLHVMLVATMLALAAKCCGIPRRWMGVVCIPSLWFYTAVTGVPASAVRATTMACVIFLGWMWRRPPESLNSIGAAALLLLFWDPLQIFQPGFQLSFVVVSSIVIFCRPLMDWSRARFRDDELVPKSYQSNWRRFAHRWIGNFVRCFAVSAIAWLGSLPLIVWYFNLFTPVSLLVNFILVLFLAPLVMASAWLALATAAWLPSVASLANSSAWLWMTIMIETCKTSAGFPFAWFEIPRPPLSCIFLYYLALTAFALPLPSRAKKILIVACVAAISGIIGCQVVAGKQRTTIAILPIPGGDAIGIDAPGVQNDWLIDGGPEWCSSFILEPFLRNQPPSARYRNHLLTHGDKQHLEALSQLFQQKPPAQAVISPLEFRSSFYRNLVQQLRADRVPIRQRIAKDRIGAWQILHPRSGDAPSPADSAPLVLFGELHGLKILLLSDLNRWSQKELLNRQPDLKADFVSLSLPADRQPPNLHVLGQLEPQVIVVTGSHNQNGERWVRSIRRHFRPKNVQVLFTGVDGTVNLTLSRRGSEITTRSGKKFPLAPRL